MRIISIVREAAARVAADNVPRMAAALAYYAVFCIAPAIFMALAIAGMVIGEGVAKEELRAEIELFAGTNAAAGIDALLAASHPPAAGTAAALAGLIVLVWGGSGVFLELRESLDTILGSRRPRRPGILRIIKLRFFAFAMVIAASVLLFAGMLTSAALQVALSVFARGPASGWIDGALDAAALLVLATLVFGVLYHELPRPRPGWNAAWAGALVGAVLFVAGEFALTVYLGRAAPTSPIGAAGSVLALLVWIYYSAQTFYFGAEIARAVAER